MFKVISLICALLLSFPVSAQSLKKDVECVSQEQAASHIKQSNMKVIIISVENSIMKVLLKSPNDKQIVLLHIHQSKNLVCLIDILNDIDLNISLRILENA